jgi:hypothetical protein
VARTRRTRTTPKTDATAEKAFERFLSRHELRYVLIEILIVATGVFIALAVDELRQTFAQRSLTTETRSALRSEVIANRARLLLKARLVHDAAIILDRQPERAAELVKARRNSLIVPFEAAWSFASQNDVLRYLPADERRRLTDAYVINAGYAELVHDEMNAWTDLAGTRGADASPQEAREREKAVAVWLAYAQREALGSCIGLVYLQRALDPRLSNTEPRRICGSYQAETDPSVIYRQLGAPVPSSGSL